MAKKVCEGCGKEFNSKKSLRSHEWQCDSQELPWRDKDTLRELYIDEGLTCSEIANRFDTSMGTVSRWLDNHGIDVQAEYPKLNNPDWIQEMYHDKGLDSVEIAEVLGCSVSYVTAKMREYGIERRPRNIRGQSKGVTYYTKKDGGYEIIESKCNYQKDSFRLHRLVAVAEFGFEAIKGKDIHHKDKIPWDNRPENLEPLTPSEHMKHHAN